MDYMSRRQMIGTSLAGAAALSVGMQSFVTAEAKANAFRKPQRVLDTHQHLWDLEKVKLPWLESAPDVLRKKYWLDEYREASKGYQVETLYMEVDVAEEQLDQEAEIISELGRDKKNRMLGAILGSRPASEGFEKYVDRQLDRGVVKGFRQVLHGGGTPAGFCLSPEFVRGMKILGERNLSFDLCMRPKELRDGYQLAKQCPGTRFVVDHCGNADPKAFGRLANEKLNPAHDANDWRVAMKQLASLPNVICKISGIVASAPEGWTDEDLAPIVNHCLDSFGPDRVVFGGDWPVCLLGAPLLNWMDALTKIVSVRPQKEQDQLWYENAAKFFSVG